MPTRVKICGITRQEDADLAVELGASALGFNFYPRSPRYIEPAKAARMIMDLPPFVIPVGVFADEEDAEHVAQIAEGARVLAIQLHGPRTPPLNGALARFPIIQAVPVPQESSPKWIGVICAAINAVAPPKLEQRLDLRAAHAFPRRTIMLDGYDARLHGGTGKTFDWGLARLPAQIGKVILAGGLTPENVGNAIQVARPFAVDVASGVESAPGIKDPV